MDNFFERQDTCGYKFDIDSKGNVFIVEMKLDEYAFVVAQLQNYFEGVIYGPPIDVGAHYQPNGGGLPSAPDVAIFPNPTRIVATNQFNRRMIARLYTRQTTPSPNHVAIIGQPGVYFEEWEFGTLDVNGNATACNGLGLPAYQINIPVQEVFWNPPIVGGVPSTAGSISDSTGGLTKSE
nr:10095_t:CDS:2 [Entrophospora candida]